MPRVVVLHAAVTTRTPAWLFLSSGVRALDHAVEAVCSPAADPRSWLEAMEAIRLLARALPRTHQDPTDLNARMDALLAMWLSMERHHFSLAMGCEPRRGPCAGRHLRRATRLYLVRAASFVLRWNVSVNADRQALVSEALGKPGQPAATAVEDFIASLGMPRTLKDVGVTEAAFGRIADAALLDYYIYTNPRKINGISDIIEILRLAAG